MSATSTVVRAVGAVTALAALTGCTAASTEEGPVALAPGAAPSVVASTPVSGTEEVSGAAYRTHFCGSIVSFDPQAGTFTFRASKGYQWGGETFEVYPETRTLTVKADGRTAVRDLSSEPARLVDGTLEERLSYAQRNSTEKTRLLIEGPDGDGFTQQIDVNSTHMGTVTDGCPDKGGVPTGMELSRTHYCGSILSFDAKAGTVKFRAYRSYQWAGETFESYPEARTITVKADGRTAIRDLASGTSRLFDGTLEERLSYAQRNSTGKVRALIQNDENGGFTSEIEVNRPAGAKMIDGCPAK